MKLMLRCKIPLSWNGPIAHIIGSSHVEKGLSTAKKMNLSEWGWGIRFVWLQDNRAADLNSPAIGGETGVLSFMKLRIVLCLLARNDFQES